MIDLLISLIMFFVLHKEIINDLSEYHMCFPSYSAWGVMGMWLFWILSILVIAVLLVLIILIATRE